MVAAAALFLAVVLTEPQIRLGGSDGSECTLENADGVLESSCAITSPAAGRNLAANVSNIEAMLQRVISLQSMPTAIPLVISSQDEYKAWAVSQNLVATCTECYSSWPMYLALAHSNPVGTLNSYFRFRGYPCSITDFSQVNARPIGDKRGLALWIHSGNSQLRSESEVYVEGYDQVIVPALQCQGVVSLVIGSQADYSAWAASQNLVATCTECHSGWPKYLALAHSNPVGTLNSYFRFRGYPCSITDISQVTAHKVGDKRGLALWIHSGNSQLRSESEVYVEGYDQVIVPIALCQQ